MDKGTSKASLKRAISKQTKEVNFRYRVAKETGTISPQLKEMFERLQHYGSKPRDTKSQIVGLGFHKHKHTSELRRQLNELNRILKHDIWSSEAVKIESEEKQQAYETFNENTKFDWSYEKWKEFVDIFGSVSNDILYGFGYESKNSHKGSETASIKKDNRSLMEAFSLAYDKRVDFLTIMEEVYDKDITGKGLDTEKSLDKLYERIREEIK